MIPGPLVPAYSNITPFDFISNSVAIVYVRLGSDLDINVLGFLSIDSDQIRISF